jgi:hypothetical protein
MALGNRHAGTATRGAYINPALMDRIESEVVWRFVQVLQVYP